MLVFRVSPRRSRVCGGADYVEHLVGLGKHGDVTAFELMVVAFTRFATKRSSSGCTVRSFLPTMYQLGFDFHAVPSSFWLNRSASGTPWVAQTSFCSCSGRSPAKHAMPLGFSHTRPSATSMWPKTSVRGNLSCWLCDVSSASGASAQM